MIRKTVTLVFCDVADSTPLGERLDPEALRGVWSTYHETARAVLERHGATIEKFVGDAVLAVFGIPVVHEDDALRAVRAAVELRDEISILNDTLEETYGVRIQVRTGVNTGEVIAGDPEQGQAFATGDAVVVAQRLEAAAPGGEILVAESTLRLVRDAVTAERIPPLELKGKSEAVVAWKLLDVDPGAAGVTRRMDSPLVGRAEELAQLRAELERAVAERTCRVVTIVGEPGVGKSRLAAELIASGGEAVLALEGKCLPYGTGITYWPLVEMARRLDLGEILAGEDDGELVRGRVLEAIGRAEPRSRSDELFWAVRRLLETLALERPLVVVVDDIQWAEPAFLDLIEYLAGWSRDAPILLLCLARPDLAELRPARAGSLTLQLAPLDRDESKQLLEHLAGPLDPAAAEAVRRATGGNPLFLEEMLRMLVEDGLLVERDGRLQALSEVDSLRVPGTVQAVLAARLDLLEAAELAVLQRAAVIGQMFLWAAVADLTPPDEIDEVARHLQSLVRKQLIRPDRRTYAGQDGFRFGHILIRDAAYDSMPKRSRAELHERFAGWMELRAGERSDLDEILGHHLEQAHAYRLELGPAGEAEAALAARATATACARRPPRAHARRCVRGLRASRPRVRADPRTRSVARPRRGAAAARARRRGRADLRGGGGRRGRRRRRALRDPRPHRPRSDRAALARRGAGRGARGRGRPCAARVRGDGRRRDRCASAAAARGGLLVALSDRADAGHAGARSRPRAACGRRAPGGERCGLVRIRRHHRAAAGRRRPALHRPHGRAHERGHVGQGHAPPDCGAAGGDGRRLRRGTRAGVARNRDPRFARS